MPDRPLKIAITCYPSVGGSGILASELGEELAGRGHEIHFISYEPPFRLPSGPRVFFHPVEVNSYDLFKYPDYTLPLSVKMAEVCRAHALDVLHVHYAVPHAGADVRRELGLVDGEAMLLHLSNLRPLKRIDLLLDTVARLKPVARFKLVVLAGADPSALRAAAQARGVADRLVVRERVTEIEDYLQAADLGLFTSEMESFCLSILELMSLDRPSAAFAVGGIPEVTLDGQTGVLVPFGDTAALAEAVRSLLADPARRATLGAAGRKRAREHFSAAAIVPKYEALYRRVCAS